MSPPSRDPWADVLARHFPADPDTAISTPDVSAERGLRLTRWHIISAACALVILLGGAGFLGYLTYENHNRADRWRDRSIALQDLVSDRTKALNRQTARLNVASTKLRAARRAIVASEQDVSQLEARQRELANEKVQIEDERAALLSVAGQLESCKDGLAQLVSILNEGLVLESTDAFALAQLCANADEAVSGYLQTYGSP